MDNIYVQTDSGLTLLDWTSNTNYVVSGQYGNVTLVVKTCYSKFKTNMSDGATIQATGNGSPIIPTDPDPEDQETPTV